MSTTKLIRPSVASALFDIKVGSLRDMAKSGYIKAYSKDGDSIDISSVSEDRATDKFVYSLTELENFFGKSVSAKAS